MEIRFYRGSRVVVLTRACHWSPGQVIPARFKRVPKTAVLNSVKSMLQSGESGRFKRCGFRYRNLTRSSPFIVIGGTFWWIAQEGEVLLNDRARLPFLSPAPRDVQLAAYLVKWIWLYFLTQMCDKGCASRCELRVWDRSDARPFFLCLQC